MVFPWFSHGFPMVFLWFSSVKSQFLPWLHGVQSGHFSRGRRALSDSEDAGSQGPGEGFEEEKTLGLTKRKQMDSR